MVARKKTNTKVRLNIYFWDKNEEVIYRKVTRIKQKWESVQERVLCLVEVSSEKRLEWENRRMILKFPLMWVIQMGILVGGRSAWLPRGYVFWGQGKQRSYWLLKLLIRWEFPFLWYDGLYLYHSGSRRHPVLGLQCLPIGWKKA